eukprot:m.6154 g.6154  ORF g.6154 m.6154 type:complete len:77 (-) comp5132_c0_seq1:138-368(-)
MMPCALSDVGKLVLAYHLQQPQLGDTCVEHRPFVFDHLYSPPFLLSSLKLLSFGKLTRVFVVGTHYTLSQEAFVTL